MSTDKKERNLYYLQELSDYKVADGYKDVRGWQVKDVDGRFIGEVDNLIVNKNTERVVYLDVAVDESIIAANYKPYSTKAKSGVHDFINEDGENHMIIPIGMANLDEDNEIVSTNDINHETFAQTKRVRKGTPIYRDYETAVLDNYTRPKQDRTYPEDDEFYKRKEFDS